MNDFDIIILGAGPGGYETALYASKFGKKVGLIEENKLGGTCLNLGCIPTKVYAHSAKLLEEIKNANQFGIENIAYQFDLKKLKTYRQSVQEQLQTGIHNSLIRAGVTVIHGHARIHDTTSVIVDKQKYSAQYIIIATGSVSNRLNIEGAALKNVITSDDILNLNTIPQSMTIIGGGVIGIEIASIFNAFGTNVCVVEYCNEILPFFDKDISKRLRLILKKKGITFINNAAVKAITKFTDDLQVQYTKDNQENTINSELVLMATGRRPNIESINLSDVDIRYNHKGVYVNENMQTNIPNIYAIGDINGLSLLAHSATYQGKIAISHIVNHPLQKSSLCPAVVFSNPEFAMIGATEEELKQKGIKYNKKKSLYSANGKALCTGEQEGIVKLLINEENKVLGAHVLGAEASIIIHELALLMHNNCSLNILHEMIHAHPTLSEILTNFS